MLTNEEKRVAIYATAKQPTIPSQVSPATELKELNLDWRERDLPERERTKHVHRLHPYLGKFIPQLVEIFLRKYFSEGQTVLDPFCGSGTTLIQANELGINSIGYDISAFNVLLCKAKTSLYDIDVLRWEVFDILEKVRSKTQPKTYQRPMWDTGAFIGESPLDDNDYLKKWFAPRSLLELLSYRDAIRNYEYQDILKTILSRSARSARLTTHFDLDFPKAPQTEKYWCYKHSRDCSPTTQAFKFLRRYSLDTLRRIEEFNYRRTDAFTYVRHGDSRQSLIPPVDGVITSPPYVGLINYHEQHAYAYHLLGLEERQESEIGAASNGSSAKAQEQYQQDICLVFSRMIERMSPGGRIIVVAGDKANIYPQVAKAIDVEVEAILKRHVNRRTGRRSNEFYESVFIWRVP